MTREIDELSSLARALGDAAGELAPGASTRALRLAERIAEQRFHVAVLGEFKRGKSTLVNALLGVEVLPMGVLPVTAVPTELRFGAMGAEVVFQDETRRSIGIAEIADFVSEARNPSNERRVERVEVTVASSLLETGLVLVDTPGVGSIHLHNTEVAEAALRDADGAILVIGADAPMSEEERTLLRDLVARDARVFVVVNKVDHLCDDEIAEVRGFVEESAARELGGAAHVWLVSARTALDRSRASVASGDEFAGFRAALESFVHDELVVERALSARRELAAIGRQIGDEVRVREAACELDEETLARRVSEFHGAASEQQVALEDDRILLEHETTLLAVAVGERLSEFARGATTKRLPDLDQATKRLPRNDLDQVLRRLVERAVQDDFEAFRHDEAERTETAWRAIAERFRHRTEERVNAIRAAAADLFSIQLVEVEIPEVAEERERFTYLFIEVGGTGDELVRAARRLLPGAVLRRRALRRAEARLSREFDKHAGRARWDLTQRLAATRRRFETAMRAELEAAIAGITAAATRADELRTESVATAQAMRERNRDVAAFAEQAARLGIGDGPSS
jgi:GTP-binding protein EngB required for normal cell division